MQLSNKVTKSRIYRDAIEKFAARFVKLRKIHRKKGTPKRCENCTARIPQLYEVEHQLSVVNLCFDCVNVYV